MSKNVIYSHITDGSGSTSGHTKNPFTSTCASIINEVIGAAILVLVTAFPLYYHNGYYDILTTKFYFYTRCVLFLIAAVLILSLVIICIDLIKFDGEHGKSFLAKLLPRNWKNLFSLPDIAVLLFWLAAGVSTLLSDFRKEAFWGNEGRYSGFYLITAYVILYFLISRFWTIRSSYMELFLISGMIMCVIGIGDYFQLDFLHFRNDTNRSSLISFTSTIGNINTYTAYINMVMGFSAALFSVEKRPLKCIYYYLCVVISFFAMITGRSDSAYLSIGALFLLLPFILFRNRNGILRYLTLVATFFTTVYSQKLLDHIFSDRVLGLGGIFHAIADFGGLLPIVILLWAAVLVLKFYPREIPAKNAAPVRIWGIFLTVCVLALVVILLDANIGGNGARYGSLGNYLVFNDSWGSSRGYVWGKGMWLYKRLSPLHKLIGSGPDTFGCLAGKKLSIVMAQDTGVFFDNVHNAYLQYFITNGVIGLALYLIFLVSSFRRLFRNLSVNPYIFAALTAAVCYAAQASVNLELPIVTPTFWLLLSIGMAGCRKTGSLPDSHTE